MKFLSWRPAAVALGALLAATGTASAQDDTVRLGGSATFKTTPAADTMTLGGQGTVDSARVEDIDLTRGGGRGGFGGGFRGGFRGGVGFRGGFRGGFGFRGGVGFRGGFGFRGVRVGIGWGRGGWGWGGGWGGGYGLGYGGYGGGYGWGYSNIGYGGYSGYGCGCSYPSYYGGYYGISATPADLNAPVVPLNYTGQAVAVIRIPSTMLAPQAPQASTGDKTFPYDGGPSRPVPQPLETPRVAPPSTTPDTIPQAEDLRVVLKASALKDTKLAYTFKAYGEK